MYDRQTLLDIHRRAHESLHRLIAFCGTMTADELRRPLTGFGFPTVLRQLEHTIGAEVYWQTVVIRGYNEEATMPPLPDLGTMEAFREQTAAVTRMYLEGATEAELIEPGRVVAVEPRRQDLALPRAGGGLVARELVEHAREPVGADHLRALGDPLPAQQEPHERAGVDRLDLAAQAHEREPVDAREDAAVAPLDAQHLVGFPR